MYIYIYNFRQDAKKINEAFIGYHADACAAIILHACQEKNCSDENIVETEGEVLTNLANKSEFY